MGGCPLSRRNGGGTLAANKHGEWLAETLREARLIRKIGPAIAAAAVALALSAPAPAQDVVKLTLADQNSPQGWGPSHALTPWIKQVEEAGKGRIKIEVFPSQTLIKGIDMWKGISSGIADIGW